MSAPAPCEDTAPPLLARTHLNVGCGEFRAPPPWWNLDMFASPPGTVHGTYPDRVVAAGEFPFTGVERLYLGHLLEHMDSPTVLAFLTGWAATLAPGAEVCVVGPDVNRALAAYKAGTLGLDELWQRMEPGAHRGTVEHWVDYYTRELFLHPGYHRINCTPQRAHALLLATGYTGIREVAIGSRELDGWPLVGRSPDQFALLATHPGPGP